MNRSLLMSLAVATLCTACRDLAFPEELENLPPSVAFLLPEEGTVTSLNPVISLDARDPNGVASVTLQCGDSPVFVWTAPPFLSQVDLTNCPGTHDASTGRRQVTLRAIARDIPGLVSAPVERTLLLDVASAAVQVSGPPRAAPRSRYVLRIQSDRPLGTVPTAHLGGVPAQVSEQQGSSMTVFDAVFDPLPDLGAARLDGGTPTLPQLEELERSFTITVEARTPNGNLVRELAEVRVSRIAWERPLPIPFYDEPTLNNDGDHPAVTADGLVLPFDNERANFLPGTLAHEDGHLIPFEGEALADEGFNAAAMDAEGRILFERQRAPDAGPGVDYVYTSPRGEELGPRQGSPSFPDEAYRRLGSQLCAARYTDPDPIPGSCGGAQRELICLSPSGLTSRPPAADPLEIAPGPSDRWEVSGDTLATFAFSFATGACATDYAVSLSSPTGAAVAPVSSFSDGDPPSRLIPLADGRFLGMSLDLNGGWRSFLLARDGTVTFESFFSPEALAHLQANPGTGLTPETVLLALPARGAQPTRLLTRREGPLETVFETWEEQATAPSASFALPGRLMNPYDFNQRNAHHVVESDGSLVLQLVLFDPNATSGGGLKRPGRDVLVSLDPELRLRWVYRAPANASGWLFARPGVGHLYYLDRQNQQVTAFHR